MTLEEIRLSWRREEMGKLQKYMTIKEAAGYLGVAPNTLRNWERLESSKSGGTR